MRQLTHRTLLYTEMTMDQALIYNQKNLDDFIGHSKEEQPLAVQLGGCNPETVGEAAYLCESYGGFSEINLNCGCPSNRAKKVGFGAELMLDPTLVRQIVSEMTRRVTHTKITVKCRLGVCHSLDRHRNGDRNNFEHLCEFIHSCRDAGVREFIIHGRSCVLCGLSPAQNRNVPPLKPYLAHRLVTDFPELTFVYNGGVRDFTTAKHLLGMPIEWSDSLRPSKEDFFAWYLSSSNGTTTNTTTNTTNTTDDTIDTTMSTQAVTTPPNLFQDTPPFAGVMIGREAYNNPFLFRNADTEFFGASSNPSSTRRHILETYLDYAYRVSEEGIHGSNVCNLVKPLHNFLSHTKYCANYKHELDALVKKHVKASKCDISFEELVMSAVNAAGRGIDELLDEYIGTS